MYCDQLAASAHACHLRLHDVHLHDAQRWHPLLRSTMADQRRLGDAEYVPLMAYDADAETDKRDFTLSKDGARDHLASERATLTPFASISVAAAVVISLLAFSLTCLSAASLWANQDIDMDLRHPSLYLGLDRVPEINQKLKVISSIAAQYNPQATPAPAPMHMHSSVPISSSSTESAGATDFTTIRPSSVQRINSRYPSMSFPSDNWVTVSEMVRYLHFVLRLTLSKPFMCRSRHSLSSIFRGPIASRL